ncbi:hypothetical protein LTR50_007859 [Elasticomyces elasticus]|nr:hypothetical protein LTR50_007859 [Elasticomyces elasticus]
MYSLNSLATVTLLFAATVLDAAPLPFSCYCLSRHNASADLSNDTGTGLSALCDTYAIFPANSSWSPPPVTAGRLLLPAPNDQAPGESPMYTTDTQMAVRPLRLCTSDGVGSAMFDTTANVVGFFACVLLGGVLSLFYVLRLLPVAASKRLGDELLHVMGMICLYLYIATLSRRQPQP